jgi:hypothetical protein
MTTYCTELRCSSEEAIKATAAKAQLLAAAGKN